MSKQARIEAQKAQAMEAQVVLLSDIKDQLDRIEKKLDELAPAEALKAKAKTEKPSA